MRDFRELVAEAQEEHVEVRHTGNRFLDQVYCGDPTAENEAAQLDNYFLETEQFRRTMSGDLNIVLGRKGSGKSAIFIQARDKVRSNRNNVVVDLAPEGFQLIKLKEFVLEQLSLGTRKELIAAFWEYIIWLEIAYKLLEKDERLARNDLRLLAQYDRLQTAYRQRAEGYGGTPVQPDGPDHRKIPLVSGRRVHARPRLVPDARNCLWLGNPLDPRSDPGIPQAKGDSVLPV